MIVTVEIIEKKFTELVTGAKSREAIAAFATAAMKADDAGLLEIEPSGDSIQIWKAISYLSGVDIKEAPDIYLHCTEDFIEFGRELGLPRF